MRQLSWFDFEQSVDTMVERCREQRFIGIHGIPRG